ncbi:MAG: DUF1501 domain-containing protein [Pseudomonadota bacterium]
MISRRKFIQLAAGASVGFGSSLPLHVQASGFADYRCLVNVFLFGGNDAFNMVVPRSLAEYQAYEASRQNLSIPRENLLPITPEVSDGAEYGLHPAMPGLQSLFEQGVAAIVANIGPLIEPTTLEQFRNDLVQIPPQLFSHNDQQDQWETLKGRSSIGSGWGGRIADVLADQTAEQRVPLNLATGFSTAFQVGDTTIPYTLREDGAESYGVFDDDAGIGPERRDVFVRHLDRGFNNIHARAIANVHRRALALGDLVSGALDGAPTLATTFPNSSLGRQLRTVAQMLAVRSEFDVCRQLFFAAVGGFDTHDNQNMDQPGLLANVSECLVAFNDALVELGLQDQVVTFTQSDFGRTLTSNGDGTDHGWGSHQLVMGGPVIGRRIYGEMPVLEIGGELDVRGGRLIPTLSSDQYAATLARWFGVADVDLPLIAPHLDNFAVRDLGFTD